MRTFCGIWGFPEPLFTTSRSLQLLVALVLLGVAAVSGASVRARIFVANTPDSTTPECDLCSDNWLFVLGAGGRTGTTTAMAMLDAIPGIELSGEHDALLEEERRYLQKLRDLQHRVGASWKHRPQDTHYMKCSIQERMKRVVFGTRFETMHKATKVFGFKEIRYLSLDMLQFIDEIFPCARYVFTYRSNPHVEVRARIFGQNFTRTWEAYRDLFQVVHASFTNSTTMLSVENLNAKEFTKVLQGLIGVRGCGYSRLLHNNKNGGYTHGKSLRRIKKTSLIHGKCSLSEVSFKLSDAEIEAKKDKWKHVRETLQNKAR